MTHDVTVAGNENAQAEAQAQPRAPKAGGFAMRASRWIHAHPNATKTVIGQPVYQFIRGGVAAIPYGISMALTLGGMAKLERTGKAMAQEAVQGSLKAGFGKRLEQLAKFPAIKTSMMVATSFTLYRGTSKIMKWMHDSLFDPKDSVAQTAEKIQHLPSATWKKMKENAPAGVASTPVAAFALGFVTNTFSKPAPELLKDAAGKSLDWTHGNMKLAKLEGRGGKLLKSVLAHPNARFVEQAAINTLGYSLFFEIGDRLFKDKQIARGVWKGDNNSIIPAKPDAPAPEKKHYGFFTNEPSVGRFVLRRMLPTAVSISAYTAFKFRHSYMHLGDFVVKPAEKILPQMPKLIKIETIAVLWFAMIPLVAEKWEKIYDGFFDKLEKKAQAKDGVVPATPAAHEASTPAPKLAEAPTHTISAPEAHARVHAAQTQQLAV